MSSFNCPVKKISISTHPNADLLEVASIDGYTCIVRKGEFRTGDLAVYIPEQAIVPKELLSEMGLEGKLAGSEGNRVKAIRLRGIFSQGLLFVPLGIKLVEGEDYCEKLGITKYEVPIPIHLSGKVKAYLSIQTYTDIENIKKYPDIFMPGEEVVAHEKLHGTNVVFLYSEGSLHTSSKGFSKRHLELEDEIDEFGKPRNTYWRIGHLLDLEEKLGAFSKGKGYEYTALYGEIVGVQDLRYGLKNGELSFAAFDILTPSGFLSNNELETALLEMGIPRVPELYHGGFDINLLGKVCEGKEQFTGKELHIREGLVVRPIDERMDPMLGRVILKMLSEAYLLRKGDATEFE